MTQEQKDLLLKDLCGRLPYGVKVQTAYPDAKILEGIQFPDYIGISDGYYSLDVMECKPYLFPLSSMTEEQRNEYHELLYDPIHGINIDYFDWCHKNHLDCRGLIPKGLAIDVTGLNVY